MTIAGPVMFLAGITLLALLRSSTRERERVFLSEALDYALIPPTILGLLTFGIAFTLAGILG